MNRLKRTAISSSQLEDVLENYLNDSMDEILKKLEDNDILNIFNIKQHDIINKLVDKFINIKLKNNELSSNDKTKIFNYSIELMRKESEKIMDMYFYKATNIAKTILKDGFNIEDQAAQEKYIKQIEKRLFDYLSVNFNMTGNYPKDNNFKDYIVNQVKEKINKEDKIQTKDTIEDNPNNTNNNVTTTNLYKEYNIDYTIEDYDVADNALQDLKNMINEHNVNNPNDQVSINIIDNLVHAKIRDMRKITAKNRLKKIAGNSIWELLKELNFNFDWIQQNQSNGVTATYYEGTIDSNGINYSNIQHFIVYYNGPTTGSNIRLKKVADQLLLDDPNKDILLLSAPKPNYYYVITADSFGKSINLEAKSIESAVDGVKEMSDFSSAEKWLLDHKSNIIARDGNSIPDDGGIWDNFYKDVYEKVYKDNGNSIPQIKREDYELTISISDTESGKKIYNEWLKKYKDIF